MIPRWTLLLAVAVTALALSCDSLAADDPPAAPPAPVNVDEAMSSTDSEAPPAATADDAGPGRPEWIIRVALMLGIVILLRVFFGAVRAASSK